MLELALEKIKAFCTKQDDVILAVLFGSHAQNTANAMSDLDIGILLDSLLTTSHLADRHLDLQTALMTELRSDRVDLVLINTGSPLLNFQIAKYGQLIFERVPYAFGNFKARAFGRFHDIKPMYDYYYKIAAERLKAGGNG
jgi:predicted nucleotidyltransferase